MEKVKAFFYKNGVLVKWKVAVAVMVVLAVLGAVAGSTV